MVLVNHLLKERIQKFREKGNLKHLYRHELCKACFPHDARYSDGKDSKKHILIAKRNISDKILKDRAYEITISYLLI